MEKINVAELLKDCPKGMKLNCTLFEDVEFDCIIGGNKWPIRLIIKDGEKHPKYGTHHSEETRRKIGDSNRGEKHYQYGKKTPEHVKEKMRQNHQCKPVRCVETGIVYRSTREASRQTGVNISGICLACRGVRVKTAGGYHWEFVEVTL